MSADAMAAPAMPPSGYPVRFDVAYPDKLSRLLIFVKWLLAIPHLLILYALGAVAGICIFIAFFAILFTKKYPKGLFDFVVNIYRWQNNVSAYVLLLRDEYPPFTWEPGQYPVTFEVDYPDSLGRFAPLYKWLLAIPNLFVLYIVLIVAYFLVFIGWFAILFTGKLPRGIHDFVVGALRWNNRLNAYGFALLTDQYPPFSMKP
jgi:hypothetical protein